jgi:hypothetical protein
MLNTDSFQTVYPDAPKGHQSNALIGTSWGDHRENWHHVENGEFQNLASTFDTMSSQLDSAGQQVKATRATLAGMQGKLANNANDMLDQLDSKIAAKKAAIAPAAPAITNNFLPAMTAQHGPIESSWSTWWQPNVLADLNKCKAAEQAMTDGVRNTLPLMRDLANTVQQTYASSLSAPTVDNAPIPTATPAVSHHAPATAPADAHHVGTAATIPGVTVTPHHAVPAAAAGSAPGTMVAPHAASTHIGLAGSGVSMAAPTAHHTGLGATAATSNPAPMSTTSNVPTLAGSGAGTLAPPPPAGLAAGSPASAVGPTGATPLAAGGSAAAGGAVPFMPFAGAPGADTDSHKQRDNDRSGAMMPTAPAAGGAGRRPGATIRPGVAKRTGSAEAAAVAGGLRGRTGEAGARSTGAVKRRVSNGRRSRNEDEGTVQFLDEEAWQTDDAGAGVLGARQPDEQTGGAATSG